MIGLVVLLVYGLSSLAYLGLAIQVARRPSGGAGRHAVLFGCLVTLAWAGCVTVPLFWGTDWLWLSKLADVARGLAWLYCLATLLQRIEMRNASARRRVLTARALVPLALVVCTLTVVPYMAVAAPAAQFALPVSLSVAILLSVFGLWLVENVMARSGPSGRWGSKYLCLGLGTLFAVDLFYYADALLLRSFVGDLVMVRGLVSVLVAPLLAMSVGRMKSWARAGDVSFQMSPAAAVRGFAVIGSGLYLLVMAGIAVLMRQIGAEWGNWLQMTFLIGGLLLMFVAAGSGRFKSHVKVFVHKYFFTYKYDYREEWRRFIAMMAAHQPLTLGERIVHAIADMMDSPAGSLWIWQSQDDAFVPDAAWNYRGGRPAERADSPFISFLRRTGWIIELEAPGKIAEGYNGLSLPSWLVDHSALWLVVPLIHRGDVLAFLVLDRARAPRRLDWEDRDLLKTVAAHAASYLAEEMAAEALSDAQRLEEFNRRFAFVVHDIKNVVGQMSLMLENARRYGDNPEFRKDMLETVSNSVGRMKSLLDQLSEKRRQQDAGGARVDLRAVAASVSGRWQGTGANVVADLPAAAVIASAIDENVAAVLDLLIDNALGAVSPTGTVAIRLRTKNDQAILEVQDDGPGMDTDFVRKELFRPLRTTKSKGYGIGAYQTRHMIREMGGQLEVDTALGKGTTMRIVLPLAEPMTGRLPVFE